MSQPTQRVKSLCQQLQYYRNELFALLMQGKHSISLSHKTLRDAIYNFAIGTPRSTIDQKAFINQKIRQNIRDFINQYMTLRVKNIIQRNDPYYFVETMNQLWANYQRFVFAHQFVVEKLKQFYQTFYRMPIARNYESNGEVVSVPIIAVSQLKLFFTSTRFDLMHVFPRHFSNFIAKEREGISVPREMLKETVNAIESCYFDFQAIVVLDANRKPSIIKSYRGTENLARKSQDAKYFEQHIISQVLLDCQNFYKTLVQQKTPRLSPSDQIDLMSRILSQQESRSAFYIHTPENQKEYINTVNRVLIGLDLKSRIHKEEGLIKYLRQYQSDKPDYKSQLIKSWKVYSRVLSKSLPEILHIYSNYLDEEAQVAEQKIEKFVEFIPEMIRINSKNIQIVEFFGLNFDLQNKRNEKIRGMLSNDIIKTSTSIGKHTLGATNLAQFINIKFKQIYTKGWQGNKQIFISLTLLFKILQEKAHFTKEHEKHIANRLLEDVDFSKDNEYTTIINLEKKFIEEMQKQMGVSEVKELLQNIRDIQKSGDHTKKLKEKLGSHIHILNQIIVKNNTFWPDKNTYDITPPTVFFKVANQVEAYFSKTSNIQFEYNNGVSLFRGEFKSKTPKQNFYLKNIYVVILFILDQAEGKRMLYGDLKSRIKSYGSKKEKGNLQLAKNLVELLHNGLIVSSTRVLSKEDPACIRIEQSDMFELNRLFDYEEQLRKNKYPSNKIKKLPVIKTFNLLLTTPGWLKEMFIQESNQIAEDEILIEKERRLRVKQIAVKRLKHAHNSSNSVTFEQLFAEYAIPKNKQYRTTEKYLKQNLEELINDDYCERVDGERNLFKYKA